MNTIPFKLSGIVMCLVLCLPTLALAKTSVTVRVMTGGAKSQPLKQAPVILRASRPKGPFEQKDPKPFKEWAGQTNALGQITFSDVPDDLAKQGLRLHAISMYKGMTFKSRAIVPFAGAKLDVVTFEKTADLSKVQLQDWRLIIEPSEGFLVFTQQFKLQVTGDKALDTALLTGEKYEKGLPITLPIKAKGLNIFGPGTHQAIDSTAYWRGVLKPGEPVNLQLRYSMSVRDATFVYEQTLDYPVINADIAVPLKTRFRKVPRMNNLTLAAIGFKAEVRQRIPGVNREVEVLYAQPDNAKKSLERGGVVKLQLRGLPYRQPIGPWIALGLGILGFIVVLIAGRAAQKKHKSQVNAKVQRDALQREREALFEDLAGLEEEFERNEVSAQEYDIESMALRERLALVLKKLDDLGVPQ